MSENFSMKNIIFIIVLFYLNLACLQADTIIEINTTMGDIQIELNPEKAPKTVANFLNYLEIGYYDGLIFHRVIDNFIIQSGSYDANFMIKDTMSPVRSEATNGLENTKGTIAMARMADPHSADSQFFINLNNNSTLNHRARTFSDYGYTVFGKIISGMDIAEAIGEVETAEIDGYEDVPVVLVIINTVKILSRDDEN
jgi:peptidyl-prolyl cis-trans isomerase B (cyclophilin B)